MALQGTIDTFGIDEVLRLLASTGKHGCLRVNSDTEGGGSIWIEGGHIVASVLLGRETDEMDHLSVVVKLLRLTDGEFHFEAGSAAPASSQEQAGLVDLLTVALDRVAAWAEVEAIIPSLNHVLVFNPEPPAETVTLTARQWRLLACLGDGAQVAEITAGASGDRYDAVRHLADLVVGGLLAVAPPGTRRSRLVDDVAVVAQLPSVGEDFVASDRSVDELLAAADAAGDEDERNALLKMLSSVRG